MPIFNEITDVLPCYDGDWMHGTGPASATLHVMELDVCVGVARMSDDIAGRELQLQPFYCA
jgi:hypothetical protein